MVWFDVNTRFDHTRCPNCNARMRLARVEPRPLRNDSGFERHIYRCDRCSNLSRFVVDRQSWTERMTA